MFHFFFRGQRQKEKEKTRRLDKTPSSRRCHKGQTSPAAESPRSETPNQIFPGGPCRINPERCSILFGPETWSSTAKSDLLRACPASAPLRGRRRGVGRTLEQRQLLGTVLWRDGWQEWHGAGFGLCQTKTVGGLCC